MRKIILDIVFYLFAFFVLFFLIPYEKQKTKNRNTVVLTDSTGKKVVIADQNGDGVADFTVGPSTYSNRPPTEAEKQYFKEHKKQKTP